jgi:plastocyanin
MHRMRRLARAGSSAALAFWLLAGPALAADQTVTIAGFAFDPSTVRVRVGDTVTWSNEDSTAHTAIARDLSFDTGDIAAGQSASVTFDTAGTFEYMCGIHPTMSGTVVVRAAAGAGVTQAPTDTLPNGIAGDGGGGIAIMLAVLGLSMLVGTVAMDRRLRRRDR